MNKEFLDRAVQLAIQSIESGGGPFGAVVVKDGVVISEGSNTVTKSSDPTAHAEIVAIRSACEKLKTFELNDCEIYSSCEPCPMCLGAIYWARPKVVYFATTKLDAAQAGFDDSFIYSEIEKSHEDRNIQFVYIEDNQAKKVFNEWKAKEDRVVY